jgi:hypothetical protein
MTAIAEQITAETQRTIVSDPGIGTSADQLDWRHIRKDLDDQGTELMVMKSSAARMKQEPIIMQSKADREPQSAIHLAARAVMAYRAGFQIESLSISGGAKMESGIACEWKSVRAGYRNDLKLLNRAFAFVYIGTLIDQEISQPISDNLRKELTSDMSSALDARETAVQWGHASAVKDTNPFAHTGYKLASRLLRADRPLIDALAGELLATETMNRDQLKSWLDSRASPLTLEELEGTSGF